MADDRSHASRSTQRSPESVIRHPSSVDGVVVIDKPAGITSHDVVHWVRKVFGTRRVGHTGTLDPMATGVLVVCLGQATRIVEYLMAGRKVYEAGVVFGMKTDSQDSTGTILCESDASHITSESVERSLAGFRGAIEQIPPMVSAIHHEGKRLYELARQGIEVERARRKVEVFRLELTSFEMGFHPRAALEVECSGGTYIRTLAADIGDALGVGGTMDSLCRTRSGQFTLAEAVTLDDLAANPSGAIRSIAQALSDWPVARLTADQKSRILHGQEIRFSTTEDQPHLLLDESGAAVAIGEPRGQETLAPVKVFA